MEGIALGPHNNSKKTFIASASVKHEADVNCSHKHSAWRMVLSHHPPCDLNRTWYLFGVNVCVRCLGMLIASILMVIFGLLFEIPYGVLGMTCCVLSILPAGIDFTFEELYWKYTGTNVIRFLTGMLFGSGGGMCIVWLWLESRVSPIVIFICASIAMQFIIAFLFMRKGHLERYLAKYENALDVNS